MVSDIVTGISTKLNTEYGDSHAIYDSNVSQGLDEPCFFIKLLKPTNTPFIGKRKMREYPFDVHYFPEDDSDNVGMMDIGDQLMEILEYITLLNGDVVKGKNLSYEIIDGVLHFMITYTVMLNDLSQDDSMEDYGLEVGVRD